MTGFAETAAAGPLLVALGVSVLAGLVSFASPCVVPLVPGYLSYLAAVVGVDDAEGTTKVRTARWRVAGAAALFVAGFGTVFVAGATLVGGVGGAERPQEGAMRFHNVLGGVQPQHRQFGGHAFLLAHFR